MHLVKDEHGNLVAHGHDHCHEHTHEHAHEHTHDQEHLHAHSHTHSHVHTHDHSHEHDHDHGHSHHADEVCSGEACGSCKGCGDGAAQDKNAALLNYMYQHNQSHAAELDQMAAKLQREGKEKAAEQIRKAVDEFQKGNLYLSLALAMVRDHLE